MELSPRADALIAALIGGGFLALYVSTMTPGLAYGGNDGQELTVVAATLGLAHPTGYPLYTWIGHLFARLAIGTVAYRTNLMSATLGAGAVAMLYLVARRLRLARVSAVYAALAFGASTTFWSQAVVTEVYAPNAFGLALTLWLLFGWAAAVERSDAVAFADRRFVVFALVYGLSLGLHMSNLSFAPAYLLFTLLTDWRIVTRPATVLLGVAAFLLGIAQFVWLPLRADVVDIYPSTHPVTLAVFLDYTVRAVAGLRFPFPAAALPSRVTMYLGLIEDNFTSLGVGLGALGMWVLLWRDVRRFWLLACMYGIHVAFFSQVFVFDIDVFFIASNLLFALFVGCGVDAIRGATAAVVARSSAGRAAGAVSVAIVLLLYVPLENSARASLRDNDRSTETAVGDFYRGVFDVLPRGSVLVPKGRGTFGSAVTYSRRIDHARPDVVVQTERDAIVPRGAPMFVAETRVPVGVRLPDNARLVPVLRAAEPDLVLYRVDSGDQRVVVPPTGGVGRDLGVATLVHVDVVVTRPQSPARVRLRALWRPAGDSDLMPVIATRVDGVTIETHDLGGDMRRPLGGVPRGGTMVEDYEVVLPSWLSKGAHALALGTIELGPSGVQPRWTQVGSVAIE